MSESERAVRQLARYGPKRPNHPSIGEPCWICDVAFAEGDYTTLIPVAPAGNDERARMEAGAPYTAEAREVHWSCADDLLPDLSPA